MKAPISHRLVRAVCAVWLAVSLLLAGAAKEWLHDCLADHEDTVHHVPHQGHDLCIEKEHHHCEFLQYHLPACEMPLPMVFVGRAADVAPEQMVTLPPAGRPCGAVLSSASRGPPVVA